MSTLAMPLLEELGFRIQLSHVFASPRVGNEEFAAAFAFEFARNIPVWRVTYHRDPAPHVPPPQLGFRHVDFEVHYDPQGNFSIVEAEDPRGANQWNIWDTVLWVRDHCTLPLATKGSLCWCPWVTPGPYEVTSAALTLPSSPGSVFVV